MPSGGQEQDNSASTHGVATADNSAQPQEDADKLTITFDVSTPKDSPGDISSPKDIYKNIETASTSSLRSADNATKSKVTSVSSNKQPTKGAACDRSDDTRGAKLRAKSSKSEPAEDLEIIGETVSMSSRSIKERNLDINREAPLEDLRDADGNNDTNAEVAF